jgi:hypothetical protein
MSWKIRTLLWLHLRLLYCVGDTADGLEVHVTPETLATVSTYTEHNNPSPEFTSTIKNVTAYIQTHPFLLRWADLRRQHTTSPTTIPVARTSTLPTPMYISTLVLSPRPSEMYDCSYSIAYNMESTERICIQFHLSSTFNTTLLKSNTA